MSYRQEDSKAEQIFGKFLDNYFYKRFQNDYEDVEFERIIDKNKQISGTDVELSINGKLLKIDEKSQLRYINKPRPTFVFELYTKKRNGEFMYGWFLNKSIVTNYYLFSWICYEGDCSKLYNLNPHNFRNVESVLIRKKDAEDYLSKFGFSKDALIESVNRIRKSGDVGKIPTEVNGIYYFRSGNLEESPINLVVSKFHLYKMAKMILNIDPSYGYKIVNSDS